MNALWTIKATTSHQPAIRRNVQRIVVGVCASAALGSLAVLGASPVVAATTPTGIDVSACNSSTPTASVTATSGSWTSASPVTWTSSSDTLSVTNSCPSPMGIQVVVVRNSVEVNVGFAAVGSGTTTSALGSDVTAIRIYEYVGVSRGALLTTLTASSPSSGGGGGSSSDSPSSGPQPIHQQFGKPVSGTCAAAAPAVLNWAGVGSGGWGESWAQWPNGGTGGAVCSRTLSYNSAQSAWIIG